MDCKLLSHGLLKASYILDWNQRELRELVQYRRSIIEERARQHNRMRRCKYLARFCGFGRYGCFSSSMLNAIAEGEEDPEKLANFARRTMKKKKDELMLALKGYINSH